MIERLVLTPTRRVPRSKKHSAASNPSNIIEVDEDEDVENGEIQDQFSGELVRSTTSISLPTTKKEVLNVVETHEKSDESTRSAGTKSKRESSIEKNKVTIPSFSLTIKTLPILTDLSKMC